VRKCGQCTDKRDEEAASYESFPTKMLHESTSQPAVGKNLILLTLRESKS
jgi:hypothetical protein